MRHDEMEVWGEKFPVVHIQANKFDKDIKDDLIEYTIADLRLWDAIGDWCMSGNDYANYIDEQIFFYTHVPVESFKTERQLINYLKKHVF